MYMRSPPCCDPTGSCSTAGRPSKKCAGSAKNLILWSSKMKKTCRQRRARQHAAHNGGVSASSTDGVRRNAVPSGGRSSSTGRQPGPGSAGARSYSVIECVEPRRTSGRSPTSSEKLTPREVRREGGLLPPPPPPPPPPSPPPPPPPPSTSRLLEPRRSRVSRLDSVERRRRMVATGARGASSPGECRSNAAMSDVHGSLLPREGEPGTVGRVGSLGAAGALDDRSISSACGAGAGGAPEAVGLPTCSMRFFKRSSSRRIFRDACLPARRESERLLAPCSCKS